MPKYRLLTKEELLEFEKEFIEYLILNSITADEWEAMKVENPSGTEKIITLFSDVVFETVLRKIAFLEYREKNAMRIFQCLPDKLVVVSMETPESEEIDFTDNDFVKKAALNPPTALKVISSEKRYKDQRERELFEMLQTGCFISDDKLFKTLCLALAHKNS